jgi:PAS domain S-box-containing protein
MEPIVATTDSLRRSVRPLADLKRWIVVFVIGALALLAIFRAFDLWWWRNDRLARGRAQADNLSHIVAEYLTGAFVATDASLRQLQGHGRHVGPGNLSTEDWGTILGSTRATLTGAGSISVTDASGIIRQSTQPVIVGQSRRSLFLFQRLSGGPADDLVIDPPFFTVSEPRHFVLPLARRLEQPDGSFNGIVVVVFEPSQLRSFFRSVDVGRRGAISVLHPNGAVLYREPSAADAIGEIAAADPVLLAARERPDGTLRHVLRSTGVPVITAFHTTGAPPLIVAVSLAEADLLDEWQREVIGSVGAFAVFSLIVVAGGIVAFGQIDGRIAAEQALQQLEQRTRFALDAARVGIWELDLTTGVLNWSPTLEALHGVAPGRFARTLQAFIDLIHPDDRHEVERTIAQALLECTDSNLLYRTTWPDGTVHWLSGIGRTFFDAAANPVRSAGVSMDVTERRRMEERFRQSQKLESIGQLAAGVAHDFNNLLTAILGHCELLEETLETGGSVAEHSVGEIRRASERAASLTQQLLAFGRRQMLAPRVLDLGTSLSAIQPMLRRLIREDIEISVRVEPNLVHVHIDPGQVEQVILNLALNARDAMPEGGTVTLELRNVVLDATDARQHAGTRAGRFAMLAVSDTGTGMDATTRDRIFEPFFTTKEQGKGTGLGLATVYGIVEQSGGHIAVSSEPGDGSSFRVYLPAVDGPVDEPPASATVSTSRGSETILVVEDESGVRALIQRVLSSRGYRVLLASTPSEALAIGQSYEEPIHLVISDVVLPEMSGPMLVEQLILNRPHIRVLYVSGYTEHAVAHRGVFGPRAPFLPKPFTAATLLQKIRKLLVDASADHV